MGRAPGRPRGTPGASCSHAPGQVEGQLGQPLGVCLGGLHQAHLAACRGEGPHLLQQRRLGPIQVRSEVLILLEGAGV